MKRVFVIVVVLAVAMPCLAQTVQPPKPGPEVQKLAYFVGTWKGENELKGGALSGHISGRNDCEWFAGGFHLLCRNESTGPAGKHWELSVRAYDEETRTYSFYVIGSSGVTVFAKGSLAGTTWTWLWDEKGWGKPATYRITQVLVSPTSYTFAIEESVTGGPWTVLEKGKATKVK